MFRDGMDGGIKAPSTSLRSRDRDLGTRCEVQSLRFGWDRMGSDRVSKVSFNFAYVTKYIQQYE